MADTLPADLGKVDPADAWKPWRPAAGGWNRKWVAHLFRRAGFGATPTEVEKALAQGPEKTLDHFLTGEPDNADRLELLTEGGKFYTEPFNLRVWWLYAMTEGGHPLREKLALFWHNHFATSYAKVRSTKLMYEQNVTIRTHALGKFRPFLLDMSKDTAMLVWLDSNRNVKAAPNENYAREVMELFALGVGGGNYTEKDIQEAARALTGWHHDAEVKGFEFRRDLHDDGPKTVFGKTGKWAGEDVVRLCCDHAACARFLVAKLYAFLVSEAPPPKALLEPLADRFRKSDYDIADLVRAVLGSRLFFSEHAYRKRVKWPVECALGAVRSATAARVPLADVVDPLAKMGQALFAPPNVKGWRTGTDWLNSATLLARNNFAEKVAVGSWNKSARPANAGNTFTTVADDSAEPKPKDVATAPAPAAEFDVCAAIYATAPKDVAGVVARMGELLYGEAVQPLQAQQIATFLRTPGPAAPPAPPPKDPAPTGGKTGAKTATAEATAEATSKGAAEPGRPEPPSIFGAGRRKLALDSPEFKARVREAYHAMMCLPEYQLS